MRAAGAVRVMLAMGVSALALHSTAWAQPPIQATDRAAVLEQLARDLQEHRAWLESQLAAAKVANAELQKRLTAAEAKCAPPPKPTP